MNAIINMMNRPHTMEQDATVVMVIISTCTVEKWMLAVDASFQSHGLWRKTQIPWLAGHTQQRRM